MSDSCATTSLLSAIRLAPPTSEARRLLRSSYVALCTILPSLALLTLYKSVNGSCKLRSHLSANSTLNIQHSTFCMLPVNLDQYSRYVTLDDSELRELNVAEGVLVRLHRLRGMYAYWLQFPSKLDNDLVQYDMAMFKIGLCRAASTTCSWGKTTQRLCLSRRPTLLCRSFLRKTRPMATVLSAL